MGRKVTLGGDRLGSGSKQQVDLHSYERSTHDLGYVWRSTMSAGTLVPCIVEVALPGDTFDINLSADIQTHPTIGPLFGSYKVQIDIFQCPFRLYQAQLHNNKLGIGLKMSDVKLPLIKLKALQVENSNTDLDNAQINPSCILAYLGIRGVGINATGTLAYRYFNGIPYLAYVDIYKNYYANKQEENGAVIHTFTPTINLTITAASLANINGAAQTIPQWPTAPTTVLQTHQTSVLAFALSGTPPENSQIIIVLEDGTRMSLTEAAKVIGNVAGAIRAEWNYEKHGQRIIKGWDYATPNDLQGVTPIVQFFPLAEIDEMRERLLAHVLTPTAFNITQQSIDNNMSPYRLLLDNSNAYMPMMSSQEGLLIKTYQSDLFNNWLETEWIDGPDGINTITAIDTSGGSFTLDTLQLSRKVYDMLNRIAVSGGTYKDWIDAAYDHDGFTQFETPMYMGGLIKELVFQEVISNAAATSETGTQPLGTLAGKGVLSNKHKGGQVVIKVDEPSYIIGIVSLTPRLDYSQGNKWDTHLETMDDLHKPGLDEIGFQELIMEQMAWWDTIATSVTGDVGNWMTRSAGKQPAWINYMTNVNRAYGNFAIKDNEMFMTLNRRYQNNTPSSQITDVTTYIDPAKFNHIFAETALDAQNFWVQIGVDMTARRKMSAKVMPNL